MKVDIYNSNNNHINTLDNVEKIVSCSDGRHLITTTSTCKCCGQESSSITQVPSGYEIKITTETGDKIIASKP